MSDLSAPRHTVLVAEDDSVMRKIICRVLERDGFDTYQVSDGRLVFDQVASYAPDVVVLDLGLPNVHGFDVLRALREASDVPILVLSGRAAESDRVLALELGADDYVVKPFSNAELVARVRARTRRPTVGLPDEEPDALGDSSLVIDRRSREVRIDGELVDLTAREFDLLVHFAGSPRQVFTRQQLAGVIWPDVDSSGGESAVTEHVHRLRKKLGGERIATVRGVGYRFDPA